MVERRCLVPSLLCLGFDRLNGFRPAQRQSAQPVIVVLQQPKSDGRRARCRQTPTRELTILRNRHVWFDCPSVVAVQCAAGRKGCRVRSTPVSQPNTPAPVRSAKPPTASTAPAYMKTLSI